MAASNRAIFVDFYYVVFQVFQIQDVTNDGRESPDSHVKLKCALQGQPQDETLQIEIDFTES